MTKAEYADLKDVDPFRQGDVFRWLDESDQYEDSWGVVITADCDIAQGKAGNYFTYLEIVSARSFLEYEWPRTRLEAARRTLMDYALKTILDLHRSFQPEAVQLEPSELLGWLVAAETDQILTALKCGRNSHPKLRTACDCLRRICGGAEERETPLGVLRYVWSNHHKKNLKSQENEIREGLKSLRGEYFFLNSIPNQDHLGFVVLLRRVAALSKENFVPNRLSSKMVAAAPPYAVRVGRLNDHLRFAIVQQFAQLFSRIGMPQEYEDDRDQIQELLVSDLSNECSEEI